MTKAENLHKRILILESRALKLAKANKDGLLAFIVKNEPWTETRGDRSRYRRQQQAKAWYVPRAKV